MKSTDRHRGWTIIDIQGFDSSEIKVALLTSEMLFNYYLIISFNYAFTPVPLLYMKYGTPAHPLTSDWIKLENVWEWTTRLHEVYNWWSGCGLWDGELFIHNKCLFGNEVLRVTFIQTMILSFSFLWVFLSVVIRLTLKLTLTPNPNPKAIVV